MAQEYRNLLPTQIEPEEKASLERVKSLGVSQCQDLEKNSRAHENLRLYSISFCKRFSQNVSLPASLQSKLRDHLLLLPEVHANISGFDSSDNALVSHTMTLAIQKSPQFSPRGTVTANFNVSGAFSQNQTEHSVPLSHSYTVVVPYPIDRMVNNPQNEAYSDSEQRCDQTGIHCWQQTVTRYYLVNHYESVRDTEYRPGPRVFQFLGTELDQTVQF